MSRYWGWGDPIAGYGVDRAGGSARLPGATNVRQEPPGHLLALHRQRFGWLGWPERTQFVQPGQERSCLNKLDQLSHPTPCLLALSTRDQANRESPLELVLVSH